MLPYKVSKPIHHYLFLTWAKSLQTSDLALEHESDVQILPRPPAHIASHVSIPFLSTFAPILEHPLGSENLSMRRPVGRPRGSGHKQRAAAAQAECAALGLVPTPTAQKRPVGRPRKDMEETNGVFIELRNYVCPLFPYFTASFDGLSGHAGYATHSNSWAERKII